MDDASQDGTAELAEGLGAKVVRLEQRRYSGGARNRGWEAARGEAVAFLDADAIPAEGWAAGLQVALEEFPRLDRLLRPDVHLAHALGLGRPPAVRDPVPPARPARRAPDALVLLHRRATGRAAALGRELRRRGWPVQRGRAGRRLPLGVRPALPCRARSQAGDLRRPEAAAAEVRLWLRTRTWAARTNRSTGASRPGSRFTTSPCCACQSSTGGSGRTPRLRSRFLRLLPWLVVGEWLLGVSALRYVVRRPDPRESGGRTFG